MKSILFISVMRGAPWGGSEEAWFYLALWLKKQGHPVAVCVYNWGDGNKAKIDTLKNAGCIIYFLPFTIRSKKLLDKIKKGTTDKWKLQTALKKIPFEKYDHVFANQGSTFDIIIGPVKFLHKRLKEFTLTYHNYFPEQTVSERRVRLMKPWIQKASCNLAFSGRIFSFLEIQMRLKIPNAVVYYNPITFPVPEIAVPYPSTTNNFVLSMFAALDIERKSQDILVKVLSSDKWKKRNWELRLYGEGKDKFMLEKLIGSTGLKDKVFLKGYTQNIQQALKDSHIVLQVTAIDAMPISVVEAMAMARPCIVSNVGDMALWVNDGTNGFVCENANETELDEVLETAWQRRTEWENMGKAAFGTFLKKYPQPYEQSLAKLIL